MDDIKISSSAPVPEGEPKQAGENIYSLDSLQQRPEQNTLLSADSLSEPTSLPNALNPPPVAEDTKVDQPAIDPASDLTIQQQNPPLNEVSSAGEVSSAPAENILPSVENQQPSAADQQPSAYNTRQSPENSQSSQYSIQMPSSETELSQQEPLPAPSAELVEAVTGIPPETPASNTGMSKTKKIGIIAGSVFIVALAVGSLFYFGQGWVFKGQVAPSNTDLKYAAVALCPTDYYAPKKTAMDFSVAKAQLLPFTPAGINAVKDAKNDASILNKIDQQTANVVKEISGETAASTKQGIISESERASSQADTLPQSTIVGTQAGVLPQSTTVGTQAGVLSQSTTVGTQAGVLSQSTTVNDSEPGGSSESTTSEQLQLQKNTASGAVAPLKAGTDLPVPEGCLPIPHDDLTQGNDQCGLIDQIYLDPSGYRINEETKDHIEQWHNICHPPNTAVTTNICGENQVAASGATAPTCVCAEGYFDVSSALSVGLTAQLDTRLKDTAVPSTLTCWNCAKLLSEIANYKSQLNSVATPDEQTAIQDKISRLEELSSRYQCGQSVTTQSTEQACKEHELRDATGACVCEINYKKAASTDICVYDCDAAIAHIIELRKNSTSQGDTSAQVELKALEAEAEANSCEVPQTKSECEINLETANNAFNNQDYDTFYEYSKKYVDANCSGSTNTDCRKILAKGVAINRILAVLAGTASPAKYTDELERLKAEYYSNSLCNNTATRCAEIEASMNNPTAPLASREDMIDRPVNDNINSNQRSTDGLSITDEVKPSNVFKDDREYYQTYCQQTELTCDEIKARFTLNDVQKLDLTEEQRTKYNACFAAMEPSSREIPPAAPDANPPPTSGSSPSSPAITVTTPPPQPPTSAPAASQSSLPAPNIVSTSAKTATIDASKVSAPVAPVTSSSAYKEQTLQLSPEIAKPEPTHASAPNLAPAPAVTPVNQEVPPQITPTGPESYLYFALIALIQLLFFRKKIWAFFMQS